MSWYDAYATKMECPACGTLVTVVEWKSGQCHICTLKYDWDHEYLYSDYDESGLAVGVDPDQATIAWDEIQADAIREALQQ